MRTILVVIFALVLGVFLEHNFLLVKHLQMQCPHAKINTVCVCKDQCDVKKCCSGCPGEKNYNGKCTCEPGKCLCCITCEGRK